MVGYGHGKAISIFFWDEQSSTLSAGSGFPEMSLTYFQSWKHFPWSKWSSTLFFLRTQKNKQIKYLIYFRCLLFYRMTDFLKIHIWCVKNPVHRSRHFIWERHLRENRFRNTSASPGEPVCWNSNQRLDWQSEGKLKGIRNPCQKSVLEEVRKWAPGLRAKFCFSKGRKHKFWRSRCL